MNNTLDTTKISQNEISESMEMLNHCRALVNKSYAEELQKSEMRYNEEINAERATWQIDILEDEASESRRLWQRELKSSRLYGCTMAAVRKQFATFPALAAAYEQMMEKVHRLEIANINFQAVAQEKQKAYRLKSKNLREQYRVKKRAIDELALELVRAQVLNEIKII